MKYSLSKFLDNLNEAFNLVESGQEVIIERYGIEFELVRKKRDYSSYKVSEVYQRDADPEQPRVEPLNEVD
jgi:hypothetical protein